MKRGACSLSRLLALVFGLVLVPALAFGGAEIRINDQASIDLGFRLQGLYLHTERDVNGDPAPSDFESFDDFRVRRARIRLGAEVTELVRIFLQTEFAEDEGGGGDMRLIDAFLVLRPHPLAHLYIGENMAPVLRQNLTSSGALLAMDRPAISYKTLTWGARALSGFATSTVADADSGLRGDVDVRDTGVTLFGRRSLSDALHIKYYLGVYDGVQEGGEDRERLAGRVQLNLGEAEPNYYNLSTYLGEKRTLGIGLAFDRQAEVADDQLVGGIDYALYTLDAFAELPLAVGTLTLEGAYIDLDLDGATQLNARGAPDPQAADLFNARQSQGDGFYIQGGYLMGVWQPWVLYETWESDAGGRGSFEAARFGLSWFLDGQHANLKVGYEIFEADRNFSGTSEDDIETLAAGVYVTY